MGSRSGLPGAMVFVFWEFWCKPDAVPSSSQLRCLIVGACSVRVGLPLCCGCPKWWVGNVYWNCVLDVFQKFLVF